MLPLSAPDAGVPAIMATLEFAGGKLKFIPGGSVIVVSGVHVYGPTPEKATNAVGT